MAQRNYPRFVFFIFTAVAILIWLLLSDPTIVISADRDRPYYSPTSDSDLFDLDSPPSSTTKPEKNEPIQAERHPVMAAEDVHNDEEYMSLGARLKRAERIYQKVIGGRKDLIKRFGPTPSDVTMFPPDVSPWPPYTVWDFFPPAFNCPHDRERIGTLGDGGKWVCGLSRLAHKKNCVIYSFGINGESSYEAEILERTKHCQIWGYDFSVDGFGPQIPVNELYRTRFKAWGLGGRDAFGKGDEVKYYTLKTLMEINDHDHIDILKIDIESSEFEVLSTFLEPYLRSSQPLPFGQLQIELHTWNRKFPELLDLWEKLEQAGLRPFFQEPNLVYNNYNRGKDQDLTEYSFINIRGKNAFIADL